MKKKKLAKIKRISFKKWVDEFHPLTTGPSEDPDEVRMLETYGDDLAEVLNSPSANIWTVVETDNGLWMISGYHIVNRFLYAITEKPVPKGVEYEIRWH